MLPELEYVPAPEYIKIDKRYARMLHHLSISEKWILFDRILEYHLLGKEITDIDENIISGIFSLLTLDFE